MRVLDLFSGLRGWSDPFRERGHETFCIDNDRRFDADSYVDISDVRAVLDVLPWQPDIILASPPCTSFTTMTMGRNWTHGAWSGEGTGQPKTEAARIGMTLVLATVDILFALRPRFFVIENPRARLRTLGLIPFTDRRTVTYCRLGEERMKPTDLWGGFPEGLQLPAMCWNGYTDHIASPRGSQNGTQGLDSALSGKIPRQLALLVCEAAEAANLTRG